MRKKLISPKTIQIEAIQAEIGQIDGCDGWLLYDFHGHNSIAIEVLQIPSHQMLSRRFFYWIPKSGTPVKIVHQIEQDALDHLPGTKRSYADWQILELELSKVLRGKKTIAMEHSKIPSISKLDSATFEWLEGLNIKVVCSWPIAERLIARLNSSQLASHKKASKMLIKAYESAWKLIKKTLSANKTITEYDVQQHILEHFEGFKTDHPPIVSIGPNTALPHYFPQKRKSALIQQNSLLLIDLWAKEKTPGSIYADLTQVAYIGKKAPQELVNVYNIVFNAQSAAIEYVQKQLKKKKPVRGADVDDVCRAYIQKNGYGQYFVHRTGHNISHELHGLGPNLDNFETNDTRELLPNTCYSVEPGIYIADSFGIRLECNMIIGEDYSLEVTGQSKPELPCLF